ncbi:MAG: hypothetical protein WDA06_04620 [Phenylobacterium sp.]
MNSDSFAAKYRPRKLDDLIGQHVIVRTLKNSFIAKKLHHAYILEGIHGTGKTSTGRIMAATENCLDGSTLEPCGKCTNCIQIFNGTSVDVREIDAASNRGIDDIRELKKEIYFAPISCKTKYVVLDECLDKNSRVETSVGLIPIGVIVNNKLTVDVKSYNHTTGVIENKPVTGWFKNSGKECFKVKSEGKGITYCSDGHLFATPTGYKKLKELSVGDIIYRRGKKISYVQEQVILGSLLGDMSIQRNKSLNPIYNGIKKACRCRIRMIHGEKQFDYIDFKRDVLKSIFEFNKRDFMHSEFVGRITKPMRSYSSKTASCLSEIFNIVMDDTISSPRKKVTRKWLDKIDYIGMAIWFGDDGSTSWHNTKEGMKPSVNFHTQCFTRYENEIICDWLKEKGYNNKIYEYAKQGRNYCQIGFDVDSSIKFIKDISPYLHQSVRYKIDKMDNLENFNESIFKIDNEIMESVVEEVITEIKSIGYKNVTYDIEVKDNNNYFVSGSLVHNCHSLTGQAAEAALKMIEEPPPNVRFILSTTEPQSLKPTIHSRCIHLSFCKVGWLDLSAHLKQVCELEKIDFDEDALNLIAKNSSGSVRNCLQNLETVVAFMGKDKIILGETSKVLGAVDESVYFEIFDAINNAKAHDAIKLLDGMFLTGKQIATVINGFSNHLRNLLLFRTCVKAIDEYGFAEDEIKKFSFQASQFSPLVIARLLNLLIDAQFAINTNLNAQIYLEKFIFESIIEVIKDKKEKSKK